MNGMMGSVVGGNCLSARDGGGASGEEDAITSELESRAAPVKNPIVRGAEPMPCSSCS